MKYNTSNENLEGVRDTPDKPDRNRANHTASFGPTDLVIGNTIGRYRLLSILGQGGMGIVFKAQDTTLDRLVALKFPSPHVLAEEDKKARFIHEAKAAAALDHPNVCTLHEIAEIQSKTFICMAYIEGKPLSEKVISGPLDMDEAIDIAVQIAKGLQKAHKRKIVHRDVKSANIMVTADGQVKITDFGLAKLAGETHLTRQGAIMGTVDYMSPEQAKGEPVDHRTDIWSLGVVLYEMLTGRLPFKGSNEQATIYGIINEKPKPTRELRSDVPVPLEEAIAWMMQKAPEDRPADMSLVIEKLLSIKKEAKVVGNVYEKPPSIAVLPFVNMSADSDQEYFCDGIAEELINALTHIKNLYVIARTSAFSFKGKNINVCEIGRELNVQTILEGSVRKAGNQLRITAQLIDTAHGHHLWSERYDREMGDVFAVQDEITLAIVNELKPKLMREEKVKLAKRRDIDIEAYHLYLKGLFFWNKRGKTNIEKAIQCLDGAVKIDPDYALAYAGLASSYMLIPIYSSVPPAEYASKARENALKAVQLDNSLAEAHASMGFIKVWYERDWESADTHFKRACELNPGYTYAHHWYSQSFLFRGRFDEAVKEMEKAFELDPVSAVIHKDLATAYFYAGQLDRAIEFSKKALEIDPTMIFAHYHIGLAYLARSMYGEALDEFQKESQLQPDTLGLSNPLLVFTHMRMDREDKAREVLAKTVEQSKRRYVSPYILASAYFAFGDNDEGFKFLNKAYKQQDCWLTILKLGPVYDAVRSDPRYIAILRQLNMDD